MVRSKPLARTVAAGHGQPTGVIQGNAKGDAAATIEADEGLEELSFNIVGSGMRWKTIGPTAGSSGSERLAMSPSRSVWNFTVMFSNQMLQSAPSSNKS